MDNLALIATPPPASWTDERYDRMKQLWIDGLSANKIARDLGGVTRNAVISKIHRHGLNVKYQREPNISSENRERRIIERLKKRSQLARERRQQPPRPHLAPSVSAEPLSVENLLPPRDFLGLTFLELERGMCRYPLGEGAQMRFCGQPVRPDHSWCEHCCTIVYRPLGEARRPFIPFRRKAG